MRKSAMAIAVLAAVTLVFGTVPTEAQAATGVTFVAHGGYPGYHSTYHHYGYGHHRRPTCRPPVYAYPPVVVPFPGHPPVVHPPVYRSYGYPHYPSSRFYYRGPGFGISIGF